MNEPVTILRLSSGVSDMDSLIGGGLPEFFGHVWLRFKVTWPGA